jgi:hypothetical protein
LALNVTANSTNLFIFWQQKVPPIQWYVSVYNLTNYAFIREVPLRYNSQNIAGIHYNVMIPDASGNIIFAGLTTSSTSSSILPTMIFAYSPTNDRITLIAGTSIFSTAGVNVTSGQGPLTATFNTIKSIVLNTSTSRLYILSNNLPVSMPYTPPT